MRLRDCASCRPAGDSFDLLLWSATVLFGSTSSSAGPRSSFVYSPVSVVFVVASVVRRNGKR